MGSSPLTRGKRFFRGAVSNPVRLIPAHAGKTSGGERRERTRGAHPRSRGENELKEERNKRARGSSPLTRGKLADQLNLIPTNRLIPAHAGKTRQR